MNPLQIYVFEGDVLLRFCPEKYHPFDAANDEAQVVRDHYKGQQIGKVVQCYTKKFGVYIERIQRGKANGVLITAN